MKITSFILPFLLMALNSKAQVTPAETATIAVKYLRADISDGRVPFFAKKIIKEGKDQKIFVIDPLSLYNGSVGVIIINPYFKQVELEKEYASENDARIDIEAMLTVVKQAYPLIKLSSTKAGIGDDPIKLFVLYVNSAETIFIFSASIKKQPNALPENQYKTHILFQL